MKGLNNMKNNIILNCENLEKEIKGKIILNSINLKLYEKDILGFIGPNGAGKTTTMKIILSLIKYTSGKVSICGYDIKKEYEKAIKNVGAIIENPDLYSYLTGYENLWISAKLHNLSKDRIYEVVKVVGLENRINDKVNKYSLGMKQRLGLAQAILNKPKLLILDEPTNGLDIDAIKKLRYILMKLAKKENMAILISSHNLFELETVCNRVCIIRNGTILSNYRLHNNKNSYLIELDNTKLDNIINNYKTIDKNHILIKTNKNKIPNIIKKLINNNISIYSIKENNISLENTYLNITRGNKIE